MPIQSRFRADLTPDARYKPSADRPFGEADRVLLDEQIGACQAHLSAALLNGIVATWLVVDGACKELKKGDVACRVASAQGRTITLATQPALKAAGFPIGIVLQGAPAGGKALVGLEGLVDPTLSGLGPKAGPVRVSSAGRPERVSSYAQGDFPLGMADERGWLALERGRAIVENGGQVDEPHFEQSTPEAVGEKLVRRAADASAEFSYLRLGQYLAVGPTAGDTLHLTPTALSFARTGSATISLTPAAGKTAGVSLIFRAQDAGMADPNGPGLAGGGFDFVAGIPSGGPPGNFMIHLRDAGKYSGAFALQCGGLAKYAIRFDGGFAALVLRSSVTARYASDADIFVQAGLTGNGSATLAATGIGSARLTHNGATHIEASGGHLALLGYAGTKIGNGVIAIRSASGSPEQPPTNGCFLWCDGTGALTGMGPSGTMKVIAPADPHCPSCGRDFTLSWKNILSGEELAVCMPCLLHELQRTGIPIRTFTFVKKLHPRRRRGKAGAKPKDIPSLPAEPGVEQPTQERVDIPPIDWTEA